jgi:virginiamycin B lyase
MAQLRILVLSSLFSFVPLASLAATGIFRERLIPGPPGGVTGLTTVTVTDLVFTEFDANRIGMLTRDGQFQEFVVPTPDSGPRGITSAGFPEAIWFTEFKAGKIGRLTLDGSFTEFAIPSPRSAPWGIAEVGGEIWFTESAANKIGRVNKDGSITEFAIPTSDAGPRGIVDSPYGGVCFAEFGADQIGCLENGRIVERGLTPGSGPQEISHDGGIGLWFTESAGNRVGVVSFDGDISLARRGSRNLRFPLPQASPSESWPSLSAAPGSPRDPPGRSDLFPPTGGSPSIPFPTARAGQQGSSTPFLERGFSNPRRTESSKSSRTPSFSPAPAAAACGTRSSGSLTSRRAL